LLDYWLTILTRKQSLRRKMIARRRIEARILSGKVKSSKIEKSPLFLSLDQVKSAVTSISVIASFTFILFLIISAVVDDRVEIVTSSVAEELSERGMTEAFFSESLFASVLKIQSEATTLRERASLVTESQKLNIKLPGADLSLSTISAAIADILGFKRTSIVNYITVDENYASWIIIIDSNILSRVSVPNNGIETDFEELTSLAAMELVRELEPILLGSFQFKEQRFSDAEQTLVVALPNLTVEEKPWAYNLLGAMYLERANQSRLDFPVYLQKAIDHFEFALDSDKSFSPAIRNIGSAFHLNGDFKAAAQKYEEAWHQGLQSSDILTDWSQSLLSKGSPCEAANLMKTHEDVVWQDRSAVLGFLKADLLCDDFDELLQTSERAVRYYPDDARLRLFLAAGFHANGQMEDAEEAHALALRLNPLVVKEVDVPFSFLGN
ncbi:MAG: hypothetical protein AAGL17_11130, partial [Cyanobacteria bacterium J06576_12]